MSVHHAIDEERKIVLTVFRGDLTDADLRAHQLALSANPRFHPSMRELVDLRAVTDVSVSSAILNASAGWPLHAPEARRALVAPTDLLFGLFRMYQTHLGEVGASQLGVFRELGQALQWLGLSSEDELPSATLHTGERMAVAAYPRCVATSDRHLLRGCHTRRIIGTEAERPCVGRHAVEAKPIDSRPQPAIARIPLVILSDEIASRRVGLHDVVASTRPLKPLRG
jgi:hypothetical protein